MIWGQRFYGVLLRERIIANPAPKFFVVPDAGFAGEAAALLRNFSSVYLFHIQREGCTFAQDSRSYIKLPVPTFAVSNNGTPEGAVESMEEFLRDYLSVPYPPIALPSPIAQGGSDA